SLRGLLDGADLLEAAGDERAADRARDWGGALRADIERSLRVVAERLGQAVIPAGPRRRVDPAMIGSLVACYPLRLMASDDPVLAATADVVRDQFCLGDAFFQSISHTGLGTYLTMQLALVELEAGDRRALDRLAWMLGAATPTFTWPEAIHPQLPGGCMGDGHHGWAAADFLSFVRNLLVREVGDLATPALALCSMLPDDWWGRALEVHDAPTHAGTLSYAVRWHGERPALLWELVRHDDVPVTWLTAPGLDPSWSSEEPRGEVLL